MRTTTIIPMIRISKVMASMPPTTPPITTPKDDTVVNTVSASVDTVEVLVSAFVDTVGEAITVGDELSAVTFVDGLSAGTVVDELSTGTVVDGLSAGTVVVTVVDRLSTVTVADGIVWVVPITVEAAVTVNSLCEVESIAPDTETVVDVLVQLLVLALPLIARNLEAIITTAKKVIENISLQ